MPVEDLLVFLVDTVTHNDYAFHSLSLFCLLVFDKFEINIFIYLFLVKYDYKKRVVKPLCRCCRLAVLKTKHC